MVARPEKPATLRARYRLAVAQLPERQREVFVRHRVHGEPLEHIATSLGLSSTDVELQLATALVALAEALDPLR